MKKLSYMYNEWLKMNQKNFPIPISPLYDSLWIARKFNLSYDQAKKLFRMFMSRLSAK